MSHNVGDMAWIMWENRPTMMEVIGVTHFTNGNGSSALQAGVNKFYTLAYRGHGKGFAGGILPTNDATLPGITVSAHKLYESKEKLLASL